MLRSKHKEKRGNSDARREFLYKPGKSQRNQYMLAEFKVLFRVLELTEGEVQGRQSARPPPQVEKLLRALLAGELDDGKRKQLCETLREQPRWLAWLAEQIKHRRKAPGGLSEVSSNA